MIVIDASAVVEVLLRSDFGLPLKAARWIRDHVPLTSAVINAAKHRPLWQGGMQMNVYPLNDLVGILYDLSATKIGLLRTRPDYMHDGAIVVAMKE